MMKQKEADYLERLTGLPILTKDKVPKRARSTLRCIEQIFDGLVQAINERHSLTSFRPKLVWWNYNRCSAFASSVHGDIVGFPPGVWVVLSQLFKWLLSHEIVFPFLGPAPIQGVTSLKIEHNSISEAIVVWDNHFSLSSVRNNVIRILFWNAIYFILMHELCHLYQGHSDYVKSSAGLHVIREDAQPDDSTLPKNELQALEMIADNVALLNLLMQPESFNSLGSANLNAINKLGNNIVFDNCNTNVIFRICAVQWVLSIFDSELTYDIKKTHPDSALRRYFNCLSVENWWSHLQGKITAEKSVVNWALAHASSTFSSLSNQSDALLTANECRVGEYYSYLVDLYKDLRFKVLPFSRYGDLPIVE